LVSGQLEPSGTGIVQCRPLVHDNKMSTIRAGATDYYSFTEALKAAEQLIDLLQQEHERGFFQLDDVILRSEETDLVFTGAEYLAFARRGVQEARALSRRTSQ
jgi:hypothetical protein